MNLALGAIVLAILLTPPLAFLFFFRGGAHARGIPKLSLVEYFLLSSVLSLFIHAGIISVLSLPIDYNFLIQFVSGQFTQINKGSNNRLDNYIKDFAKYNFLVCSGAAISGYTIGFIATFEKFRRMLWLQKLRKNKKPSILFQYYNRWWYFFRANEYNSSYHRLGMEEPLVFVDALLDTKDVSILYSGILEDFVVKDDNLEYIYLATVTKRLLTEKELDGSFSLKEGDANSITPDGTMCIPCAKAINIYVRHISTDLVVSVNSTPSIDLVDIVLGADPIEEVE